MSEALDALAERHGIEPAFTDYFGNQRRVGDATKRRLLDALGVSDEPFAAQPELPPAIVLTRGTPLRDVLKTERPWRIDLESGERFAGDARELPLGYHRLTVRLGGHDKSCALVSVPHHCYLSEQLETGTGWALGSQVYALRSKRNWGIGDFGDLAVLAEAAGSAGGHAVALNPLHELHPTNPHACSPYAPSSRLFLNGLYIDVERVPELSESPAARAMLAGADFQARLHELRTADLVEYGGVAQIKRRMLELLFATFRTLHLERPGDARAAAFRTFLRDGGLALERLARYEALAEHLHARDETCYGWQQWPPEFRSPESPAVERFARDHRERVDFFAYLQWLADAQLAHAADYAAARGVGLYRDLAVGVDLNGADAWADQATLLGNVSLGAPPDHLNALGQNWGLLPLSPRALQRRAFAPFAALLRANMRHAAILRIDHVMALRRCFWIPRGESPLEGAYVRYPFEQMIGILALESTRHRCAVVGEDLGTVPDGFRERMRLARTLSTRLVYFERSPADGTFNPPSSYPALAAASVGTHDLPPLAGWWTGDDLALRARLRLFTTEDAAREAVQERRHARFTLVDALERAGAAGDAHAARLRDDAGRGGTLAVFDDLFEAVHRFLAATPACLKVVSVEDVLRETCAVNLPGTVHQHPNWRRKHSLTVEELAGTHRLAHLRSLMSTQHDKA